MTDMPSSPDIRRRGTDPDIDPNEDARLRSLLRGALDAVPEESPDVLRGVQRKLRERSGGKFYADGWSTTRYAPISTFFVTSLMMLSFIVFIYFVIHPLSGSPEMVKSVPTPFQIVPSR
jgi:hypothetical protein